MSQRILDNKVKTDFWAKKLKSVSGSFFYDMVAPIEKTTDPKQKLRVEIPASIAQKVLAVSKQKDLNVYKLLLATLCILRGKYSLRYDQLLTTSSIQIENEAVIQKPALLFFNLPFQQDETVKQLLSEIHQELISNLPFQQYDYEAFAEEMFADIDLNRIAFDLGLYYEPVNVYHEDFEKTELLFHISRSESDEMAVMMEYNLHFYDDTSAKVLANHFIRTLELIANDFDAKISTINFITDYDNDLILNNFNLTKSDFPRLTVLEQFERQAERRPDALAIKSGNITLTYRELNEKGNQIAHYLIHECGLKPQDKVALMVSRSEKVMTGIMGILKAGGVYIPIDVSSPKDRIEFCMEDSESHVVLTEKHVLDKLNFEGQDRLVCIEDIDSEHTQNLHLPTHEDDLVYMIYTSGTTGNPKGSMVYHRSLSNNINWFSKQLEVTEHDSSILINSYNFDGSYQPVWAALTSGCLLHIPNETLFDPDQILKYIKQEQITFMKIPPSTFGVLVNAQTFDDDPDVCNSMRNIVQGGEAINIKNLKKYFDSYPNAILTNHYGPTECTIGCTAQKIVKGTFESFAKQPVIGAPYNNQHIYILDTNNELLPVGVPGEICIGGAGVGKGYFKREELTAKKFITDPYFPLNKIYKTGDQGRWLANGTVEFVGRIDNQVKIRGFRVELDEVAETLKDFGGIRDAIVMLHNHDNEDHLLAYIVTNKHEANLAEIQAFMKSKLPEYMLPSYYVSIKQIPLTGNGKIDKRALPDPEIHRLRIKREVVAPSNETESKLLDLWTALLDNPAIGVTDSFFEVGGHSLKATQLVSLIHKTFQVKVSLKTIFLEPTIEQLAKYINETSTNEYQSINPVAWASDYALSHSQYRLWVIDQMKVEQGAYNIPHAIRLKGKLKQDVFEKAINTVVKRHESLRTEFMMVDDEPRQRIIPIEKWEFIMDFHNLEGVGDADKIVGKMANMEVSRVFNLSKSPLFHTRLVRLSEVEHVFFFTLHHIISDGWSTQVFSEEILRLYSAFNNNTQNPLEPLRIQYKDFAAWQNHLLGSDSGTKLQEYWLKKLEGDLPILDLQTDFNRPKEKTFKGDTLVSTLNTEVSKKLVTYTQQNNGTLFMTLLAATKVLLYRYTGQQDIIVGSPIAGREHADLENQIGFYVNTLALRSQIDGTASFDSFFQTTKNNLLEAYQHQSYPFDKLIEQLNVPKNTDRNPLFDVVVAMQNNGDIKEELLKQSHLGISQFQNSEPFSKFDLTFTFKEQKEGLEIAVEYSSDLFSKARIQRLTNHLKNILNEISSNPSISIDEIPYLDKEELSEILINFAGSVTPVEKQLTVQKLFEKQVKNTPNAVALVDETNSYTYQELNQRANQIANYILQNTNIQKDSIVAILMNRGADFVMAMLAILKAGAAYLPIEASTPPERVKDLLDITKAKLILTDEVELSQQFGTNTATIVVNQIDYLEDVSLSKSVECNANSLAYVMFTSGSTGKPKGVMIEHRGIVRLVSDTNYTKLSNQTKILQTGSLAFDAATFEIWGALLNGGQVHILNMESLLDVNQLEKAIIQKEITLMFITTSWFNQLADIRPNLFSTLNHIITGGEKASEGHIQKVKKNCPNLILSNAYGPTENTTYSTCGIVKKNQQGTISLGRPISNSTVYILDKNRQPVSKGIIGEIYLGGEGLSRGYIFDEVRTQQQFVQNPFAENERLYRSGDLGYWLENGEIAYTGRADNQVKIRGFRIEPDEIASVIRTYQGINEAVVLVHEKENKDKVLVAYFTSNISVKNEDLKLFLVRQLPSYMIPSSLMELEIMPLNANGKTDRKALPEPVFGVVEHQVPQNEIETILLEIWSEVLGMSVESISTQANFFEIGGHSLKATLLTGQMVKKLAVNVSLSAIFQNPTIQSLASYIQTIQRVAFEEIPLAEIQDYYPVSPAQRRLFIIQQFDNQQTNYNITDSVVLEKDYTLSQIVEAFKTLINRHESLRTSFELKGDEIVQQIHPSVTFKIEDYSDLSAEEAYRAFVRPFDFSQAPLCRVGYTYEGEQKVLMIDVHHIVSDGTSQAILQQELLAILDHKTLPDVPLQYKDYATWLNSESHAEKLKIQEAFWTETMSGELPIIELPTDFTRPEKITSEGVEANLTLTIEETAILKNLCQQEGITLYMGIMAVWTLVLSRLSKQDDIIIGSPVAGRNHPDLQGIVGMFVNTIPVRLTTENQSVKSYLFETKKRILAAFENQDFPFEEIVEKVWHTRDTARNPLFDVMFSFLNIEEIKNQIINQDDSIHFEENKTSKFDLNLRALELGEQLYVSLSYRKQLFKQATIERVIGYFRQMIRTMASNVEAPLSSLKLVTPTEEIRLIETNNQTERIFLNRHKTVNQLFEEKVILFGSGKALVDENSSLTYEETNQYANRLANLLRKQGVVNNSIVGILLPPSVHIIVSILGIFKAGGAYLPIDTNLPKERISHILEDSQVNILITESSFADSIDFKGLILQMDDCKEESPANLTPINNINSLAYVIYTSGSTGKPKGVPIRQQSLVNYICWFERTTLYSHHDKVILTSSYSFDMGHSLVYPTITSGGELHIVQKEVYLTPSVFGKYMIDNKISFIKFTPTLFSVIINSEEFQKEWFGGLRFMMLGGEAINVDDLSKFVKNYPDKFVINHFGPTETTIGCITQKIDIRNLETFVNQPVIGKPIDNVKAYVLDKNLQLLPEGVAGQLFISGLGTSPGYLHKPELTAEKFIQSPFHEDEILYATGDLAKWTSEGKVVYLGRTDHQVKIRGYRVELMEIEKVIAQVLEVKEVCVLVKTDKSEQTLIAYFTSHQTLGVADMIETLKANLPDYMIPTHWTQLTQMPLTPNGKIDRVTLGKRELDKAIDSTEYFAPSTPIENAIHDIWASILGYESISTQANFFNLGGHSLKALKVTTQIAKQLNVAVPLKVFFQYPSIQTLASWIEQAEEKTYEAIEIAPVMENYPLSHSQKRLWILQQLDENTIAYNVPSTYRLQGDLQVNILQKAFEKLVARHEILRTSFKIMNGEPRQFIHALNDYTPYFQVIDATNEVLPEAFATEFLTQKINQAFDLAEGRLLKVYLVKIDSDQYSLLINLHHIISDGWSSVILLNEIFEYYNSAVKQTEYQPQPLAIQYKDYAYWQNQSLLQEDGKSKQYWLNVFEGELPRITLPEDKLRPSVKTYHGNNVKMVLPKDLSEQLETLCKVQNTSMFMTLLAAFKVLLSRYTGLNDLILGTPVAGREKSELANQLGFYVNTLAIRTKIEAGDSFLMVLQTLKENVLNSVAHQQYPFDKLVSELHQATDPSRSPLFDIMFVYQNNEEVSEDSYQLEGLQIDTVQEAFEGSKFDLSLVTRHTPEGQQLYVEYNTDIYHQNTIERILGHYSQLLQSIVEHPNQAILDLSYLGNEQNLVVSAFNQTQRIIPNFDSMQQYFERQVIQNPEAVALRRSDFTMTYQELNQKANQLAWYLLKVHHIQKEQIIAFSLERSEWQIITMLGILKAGAAFLPIDVIYPEDRKKFIIQDAQPALTIIDDVSGLTDFTEAPTLRIDKLKDCLAQYASHNPNVEVLKENLAYVIYTSGSTGVPKGVLIEHRGNINMVNDQVNRFDVKATDRCLQFASISFDASVYEVFIAFYAGSSVVLLTKELIDNPEIFTAYIEQQGVTFATLPPVYLGNLEREILKNLRVIVTAGEAPNIEDAHFYSQHLDYYNAYGPTEFSVCATVHRVKGDENVIPIGEPLNNTQVYILDNAQKPLPVGFWGEMYLSGTGIARGYLNRPQLNEERFVKNPFIENQAMYKTGDIARWMPNGEIEYYGRTDNMVKIRGYRVELIEIEHAFEQISGIHQAIVTYDKSANGRDQLCVYFLKDGIISLAEIKQEVHKKLPQYMIPNFYFELEHIPVTSNGKIDFKQLPKPEDVATESMILPQTELEESLWTLWKEVLKTDNISIDDNFFEIGGQSILAMKLNVKIWKVTGKNVSLRDFMKNPTIQELANFIENYTETKGLLMPLNRIKEGNPNMYMIPPVLGSSSVFQPLAAQLAHQQINCFGLQYRGFDYDENPDVSLEAMAQSFVNEITTVENNSSRKITVLGYSMGALIAKETAYLLENLGYEVFLVLVDKDPHTNYAELSFQKDAAGNIDDSILDVILAQHLATAPPDFLLKSQNRIKQLLSHNISLLEKYTNKRIVKADILALESKLNNDDKPKKKTKMQVWESFTQGRFRHQIIEGNHFTLLNELYLTDLVEKITSLVEYPSQNQIVI
jgi:tyrocidine synthetase III